MKKNLDEYISHELDAYEKNQLENPESIKNTEFICQLDDCKADFLSTLNDSQFAEYIKYAMMLFEYKCKIKEEYFSAGFIQGLNTKKSQIKM